MPRITPCRILKIFLLVWLSMIGLWFFLPSPAISAGERNMYIQNTLASGRPLITAHQWSRSFDYSYKDRGQMGGELTCLLIRWQLVSSVGHDGVALQIGDDLRINLADVIARSKTENSNGIVWTPYLSDPYVPSDIWAGGTDHVINMPWFHNADKNLFHFEMHGFRVPISIRIVVPAPGIIEVWKDTVAMKNALGIKEETVKLLKDADRESGLLATFKDSKMEKVEDIIVQDVKGELPSRTYPIRKALLFPLGPVPTVLGTLLVVLYKFSLGLLVLVTPYLVVYSGVVVICWLCSGRPHFEAWSADFWLTKWIYSRGWRRKVARKSDIWGPAGPVFEGEDERWLSDEEKLIGLRRPENVQLRLVRKD